MLPGNLQATPSAARDGRPEAGYGYRLTTFAGEYADKLILMSEVRLYLNTHAPTYQVVGGEVSGAEPVQRAGDKLAREKLNDR